MYVDWDYYKIFYYVAKYQNFTKAARVLGSNQPNITHTMNKLEDQLHCVLFIRSNRGVTLTPEGENLYARISSAAVQIQDAEEELSASASLSHGAISISATETALNIYLSEQLQPASQAHFADEFAGGYPVPLGLPGLRPPPPAKYRRAGVPPPAVGISEKQTKVNKKPAAPASLCTRYRRGWLSLLFGGNRVRNATRSAGFPGLQGVR